MGKKTYIVPMAMPPSRAKLVAAVCAAGHAGVVVLQGGEAACRDDTDHEIDFRQESYSHLFGVREPEWWGAIDLATGAATLFMPRLPDTYSIWQGRIAQPDEMLARYAPEAVRYVDELPAYLSEHLAVAPKPSAAAAKLRLHVLAGPNTTRAHGATTRRARGV